MKPQRQRAIADLIRHQRVGSQAELARLLRARGEAVTQATLSRDLEELGAYKARTNGRGTYRLPDDPAEAAGDWLQRMLREFALDVTASANIAVVRTPPGGANPVARAMDAAGLPEVIGTVAGDDTIIVVCRGDAAKLVRRLRSLIRPAHVKEA